MEWCTAEYLRRGNEITMRKIVQQINLRTYLILGFVGCLLVEKSEWWFVLVIYDTSCIIMTCRPTVSPLPRVPNLQKLYATCHEFCKQDSQIHLPIRHHYAVVFLDGKTYVGL